MEMIKSILLIIGGIINIILSISAIKQYIELLDTKFLLYAERKGNEQWRMMCESYRIKLEKENQ